MYYLCGGVEQAELPLELQHVLPWLSLDCESLKFGHPNSLHNSKRTPKISAFHNKTLIKSQDILSCQPSREMVIAGPYPDPRDAQTGAEPAPHLHDIPHL